MTRPIPRPETPGTPPRFNTALDRLSRAARIKLCLVGCAILVACGGGGSESVDSAQAGSTPSPAPGPSPSVGTATLQWAASSDARVQGYRVYYGTSSRAYVQARGSGLDAGLTPSYVVANLPAGARYYFAVTAYDGSGSESDFSAEASKLVQ